MKFVLTLALIASMAFASESEVEVEAKVETKVETEVEAEAESVHLPHGAIIGANNYGYAASPATQPTYAWKKGLGYGIYDLPKQVKPRIANDGYRVKKRTSTDWRVQETINAKCIMLDPDQNNDIYGAFRLV